MLTKEDIDLMYHPEDQPKTLDKLQQDNLFTVSNDALHFYRVIANNAFEVIAKSMDDSYTKYYSFPPYLNVNLWVMKH